MDNFLKIPVLQYERSEHNQNGKQNYLEINYQRETFVMRRPELKVPTLGKWLISPLVRVIIKICEKHLVLKTNSNIDIYNEFLYNNSCMPVCKLLSFSKVPKTLNNSGTKIIQLLRTA